MRNLAAIVFVAAALSASAANANVVVTIDKSTQRMTVQVDGATRWTWPVSTGRRGHATPSGSFQAFRMERDHFSKEWDDAPMPHSIFFTKRGHAIHGSYETRRLGSAASAGCVRLHPENARRLFALVEERGVLTTKVIITGNEPRTSAPAVARQQQPQRSGRAAQYQDGVEEYLDPRAARPVYRQPSPYYTQPGYQQPPPPGYRYVPQPYYEYR